MDLLIGLIVAVGVVYGMIVSHAFRAACVIVASGFAMFMWMLLGDPFGWKQAQRAIYAPVAVQRIEPPPTKTEVENKYPWITAPDCSVLKSWQRAGCEELKKPGPHWTKETNIGPN